MRGGDISGSDVKKKYWIRQAIQHRILIADFSPCLTLMARVSIWSRFIREVLRLIQVNIYQEQFCGFWVLLTIYKFER